MENVKRRMFWETGVVSAVAVAPCLYHRQGFSNLDFMAPIAERHLLYEWHDRSYICRLFAHIQEMSKIFTINVMWNLNDRCS